jgi:hypothetical protein
MAKEKGQNDNQRSSNIKQKTKDQETRTLRQIEGELRYPERDNCVPAPHEIPVVFLFNDSNII